MVGLFLGRQFPELSLHLTGSTFQKIGLPCSAEDFLDLPEQVLFAAKDPCENLVVRVIIAINLNSRVHHEHHLFGQQVIAGHVFYRVAIEKGSDLHLYLEHLSLLRVL